MLNFIYVCIDCVDWLYELRPNLILKKWMEWHVSMFGWCIQLFARDYCLLILIDLLRLGWDCKTLSTTYVFLSCLKHLQSQECFDLTNLLNCVSLVEFYLCLFFLLLLLESFSVFFWISFRTFLSLSPLRLILVLCLYNPLSRLAT